MLRVFGIAGGWCGPKKALEPEHLADALTDIAAIRMYPGPVTREHKNFMHGPHLRLRRHLRVSKYVGCLPLTIIADNARSLCYPNSHPNFC